MLTLIVLGSVAFGVSALTLFTGFGLGTLLLPAFALFFPVPVAVGATAVVHILNNLFKLALLHRSVAPRVLVRFGLPAVATSFLGAALLGALSEAPALFAWGMGERRFAITPLGAVMGLVIIGFAIPELRAAAVRTRGEAWLPLGGALAGFFGGLSGHQGALRAAFLGSVEMQPVAFAATQAALACMVDAARLLVYGSAFSSGRLGAEWAGEQWLHVGAAAACALAGTMAGRRLLPRAGPRLVRRLTGALLLLIGAALAAGVI